MKKKLLFVLALLIAIVGVVFKTEIVSAASCEGVETSFIECGDKESGIGHIIGLVITIMTIGIGILATIGILVSGIQYLTAKDNEAQVRKSKQRILEIIIGLAAYAIIASLLRWLFPGGSLDPSSIPHYENQSSSTNNNSSSNNTKPSGTNNSNNSSNNSGNNNSSNNSPTPTMKFAAKTSLEKDFGRSYWLNIPENATDGMPLVVFLHGSGERGSSKAVKNLPQTKYIMDPSRPYIAIAPVLEKNSTWTGSSVQSSIKKVIDKTVSDYKIDTSRIYLIGFSLGSSGAWRMVNSYPDLFAAAVPISGRESGSKETNFKHTKIHAAAGSSEGSLPKDMQKFVDKINKAGGSATMTVYPGKNHSGMQHKIDYDEIFNWLLKQ